MEPVRSDRRPELGRRAGALLRALAACACLVAVPVLDSAAEPDRPTARGIRPPDGDLAVSFACEVDMRLDLPREEQESYAAHLDAALAQSGIDMRTLAPQHVVLVDRDPKVQAAFLYRSLPGGDWWFEGAVPASTGIPGTFEHFATPLGVFAHTLDNPDFRAEGTLNENGILGYGRKGMRVFDFGWVAQQRGWGDHAMGTMRLQLHATDPGQLEGWLGIERSKGCIRVPATFDAFLDRHGVLDADYEEAASAGRELWVLRPDRETTRWPGRWLVVIDTARESRPAWSPVPDGRPRRTPFAADCPPPG